MKKVHWTQTPEGKKRLSEVVKKSYASGTRKTRPRGKAKKKAQIELELLRPIENPPLQGNPQFVALDAIPDRPTPKEKTHKAVKVVLDTRAELALALVKLVAQLTQEK